MKKVLVLASIVTFNAIADTHFSCYMDDNHEWKEDWSDFNGAPLKKKSASNDTMEFSINENGERINVSDGFYWFFDVADCTLTSSTLECKDRYTDSYDTKNLDELKLSRNTLKIVITHEENSGKRWETRYEYKGTCEIVNQQF